MNLETAQITTTAKLPTLKQENGNSFKPAAKTTTNADGTSTILIPGPVTTEEKYKDAKTLFAAIQTRFGGNEATKKTQKTLLKQMYENFSASKGLLDLFLQLQKIVVSWLLGENISQENPQLNFRQQYLSEVNTAYGVNTANTQVSPASTQVSTASTQVSTANYMMTLYMADDEVLKNTDLRLFRLMSLDKLIGIQIPDKSRKGLRVPTAEFEGYGPKTSKNVCEDTSNKVRESPDAPMVEKLVSDDKSQSPRGNQRIWNNQNSLIARKVNAVKALACWVWRPTKLNSALITLKKHNYVDARGISKSTSRNLMEDILPLGEEQRKEILMAHLMIQKFQMSSMVKLFFSRTTVTRSTMDFLSVKTSMWMNFEESLVFYCEDSKYHLWKRHKHCSRMSSEDVDDSPFDFKAYTDSDFVGASLDRKFTTGGCQFLRSRLISWQCKKQTIVSNSNTEAEYVAAASYCGQLEDSDGISNLPTTKIFEQLALMSSMKTAWEQFSSNIAIAIICLATNRKFNFSKMIFDGMGPVVQEVQGRHKHDMEPDFEFTTAEEVYTAEKGVSTAEPVSTAGASVSTAGASSAKDKGKAIMEEAETIQTKTKLQLEQERLVMDDIQARVEADEEYARILKREPRDLL
ncbi:hypothetical protein Tco_0567480 [Tanacetum coccineum]